MTSKSPWRTPKQTDTRNGGIESITLERQKPQGGITRSWWVTSSDEEFVKAAKAEKERLHRMSADATGQRAR